MSIQANAMGHAASTPSARGEKRPRASRTEDWRAIPGFAGIYVVSDQGRVKRLAGTPRTPRDRILRPSRKPEGYAYVDLYGNGPRQRHHVHALVSEAFLGRRPVGHVVHHKDGGKDNNVLSNLTYVTSGENERLAYEAGLKPVVRHPGRSNPNAKLSALQVAAIRSRLATGEIGARIAADFGVTRQLISQIRTGSRWTMAR